MDVKERTKNFLQEIRLPVTRFAEDVGLSANAIHQWFRGDLDLSNQSIERIDKFLKSLNRWYGGNEC